MRELVLTIESVPTPLYGVNLHSLLKRSAWDDLGRQIYEKYNYRCAICKAGGTLHCHEVWKYDDSAHIQRLVDLVALCELCHHCKHMGLSQIRAKEGKLDLEAVYHHFCRINGISRQRLYSCINVATIWQRARSAHAWTTDFGEWAGLLDRPEKE